MNKNLLKVVINFFAGVLIVSSALMYFPTLSNKSVEATDIGNIGDAMRNYKYEEISVDSEDAVVSEKKVIETEKMLNEDGNSVQIEKNASSLIAITQNEKTTEPAVYVSEHKIIGENIKDSSSLSIVYNQKGEVLKKMTLLGSQMNYDIRVQYYVNSEKKINMIVDTEGTIISGDSFSDGIATKLNAVKENSRNKRSVASWGSCMGSCLKSKGVESWVISAVTTLCSLGCFLTAGAGCIGCIVAAAAMKGSQASTCAVSCAGK